MFRGKRSDKTLDRFISEVKLPDETVLAILNGKLGWTQTNSVRNVHLIISDINIIIILHDAKFFDKIHRINYFNLNTINLKKGFFSSAIEMTFVTPLLFLPSHSNNLTLREVDNYAANIVHQIILDANKLFYEKYNDIFQINTNISQSLQNDITDIIEKIQQNPNSAQDYDLKKFDQTFDELMSNYKSLPKIPKQANSEILVQFKQFYDSFEFALKNFQEVLTQLHNTINNSKKLQENYNLFLNEMQKVSPNIKLQINTISEVLKVDRDTVISYLLKLEEEEKNYGKYIKLEDVFLTSENIDDLSDDIDKLILNFSKRENDKL